MAKLPLKSMPRKELPVLIAILAGGQSRRMGRDKSRLRWGPLTLLQHVRHLAKSTRHPVCVIRRDLQPGLGPLGGILTAFHRRRAGAILFLACDMPFITPALIHRVLQHSREFHEPVFADCAGRCGFPFLLRREDVEVIQRQVGAGDHSLQGLCRILSARKLPVARRHAQLVRNLNTPEEWRQARPGER